MSKELQEKLKAGDIIVATKDARFPKSISPKEHYSQRVGDMIMVNNPKMGDRVGGVGLWGVTHSGRPKLGLCSSFHVDAFRLATPDDPGYVATRERWFVIKDDEIRRLRHETFLLGVGLIVSVGFIAFQAVVS